MSGRAIFTHNRSGCRAKATGLEGTAPSPQAAGLDPLPPSLMPGGLHSWRGELDFPSYVLPPPWLVDEAAAGSWAGC